MIKEFLWELLINGIISSRIIPYRIRGKILNWSGCNIVKKSAIHSGCFLTGNKLKLGEGSYINRDCYLDCKYGEIRIEENVGIGPRVQIYTTNHDYNDSSKRTGVVFSEMVTISKGVWIGGGAIICPGVKIGEGCIIAAGSVVVSNCQSNCLYAGNPARVAKKLGALEKL